ncbi:hypothetical protein M407DRAFT_244965 [Tulasnella calospora MUT 4182]|uniref:BTB domain-containing protein n=1 Tax=Tulasnella calospora MUT 4182 TaxID=1051891 RepID=A0A0C3LNK9_9AGAM|nr:hypothetical protein M407DRAFT_244965 [Tulasnella calospora MUT 4182]
MASEVFRDMLTDEHLGSPKEGTEENPIRMEKISRVSLSQVKAFYKIVNCRRFDAEPTLPVKQWSEALQLATMWGFEALRKFIIDHLDSLLDDPLSRIELADQCGVKEWLHPAYAKLCAQGTPPTVKEGRVLGLERFAALCRIREEGMKNGGYSVDDDLDLVEDHPFFKRGGYRNHNPRRQQRSYAYNNYDNDSASGLAQEVPVCQQKCCKPRFELNPREKGYLAAIAKAIDL